MHVRANSCRWIDAPLSLASSIPCADLNCIVTTMNRDNGDVDTSNVSLPFAVPFHLRRCFSIFQIKTFIKNVHHQLFRARHFPQKWPTNAWTDSYVEMIKSDLMWGKQPVDGIRIDFEHTWFAVEHETIKQTINTHNVPLAVKCDTKNVCMIKN